MDQARKPINLWPITRSFVGFTSLGIGMAALYLSLKIIIGKDLSIAELAVLPQHYFTGLFSSWPRFFIGSWLLLTIASKIAMITNKRIPLSLISVIWFVWFITIGRSLFPQSPSISLSVDAKTLVEASKTFGFGLDILLFTDMLDGLYSLFNRFETWVEEESKKSDD